MIFTIGIEYSNIKHSIEKNSSPKQTNKRRYKYNKKIVIINPINIDKNRKLSASAVEDEARVSRSLSRHYPDTFAKIQEAILLSKSKKLKDDTGIIRKPKNDKNLKEEINKLKEDKISLQEKCDKLIAANIGLAQRIRYLESKIQ